MRKNHFKIIISFLFFCSGMTFAYGQADFGAYYTKLKTGQKWEEYSRVGEHADIIVQMPKAKGQLVFWRGNSYLPYWKTDHGQWDLSEIVHRSGDGEKSMPDKVNTYSHVEIMENTPSSIIIHWRYLASFTMGNPHGEVNSNNFTEEDFRITPDGKVQRVIRKGTEKIDEWNDPLNRTTQVLKLSASGISEISLINPGHSLEKILIKGNPVKVPITADPNLCFTFDEGTGDSTAESISKMKVPVPGHKTLWKKGVSGTALQFDGYNTVVSVPASPSHKLSGGSLSIEGWFAIGAYPWNWAPIVQQGDDDGFFLGVDSHGYPGFMAKINGWWHQLSVPNKPPFKDSNHLELFRWYCITGVYNKTDGMMRLYINGIEIASKYAGTGGVQTVNADIRIGKADQLRQPTEGTNTNLESDYGFDGLIDELRIYNVAFSASQVAGSFKNLDPGTDLARLPDMQKRSFPNPSTNGRFGAVFTHLPYYETWENLWRFGQNADVVIGFDQLPVKYVFWRGVSYIPMMVNELNQWFTNEFSETGFSETAPGDCEPMSDKGCWDSHVRVIENNAARVVIEWRYRLANASHHWANYDTSTGWGDMADWYFYIYPDGAVTKNMRCYASYPDTWYEWNEQIAVLGEGQQPGSVIEKEPVMTLVDSTGKSFEYNWVSNPPNPDYKGKIIQKIHLTGKYDPFSIQEFNGGSVYSGEVTWYSVTPSWNHWPTAQINSSGRNASFPDRAAHSSISGILWPASLRERGKISFNELNLIEGMTDKPAAALTSLAKSWLKAPSTANVKGGISKGYEQSHRAYQFVFENEKLSFQIMATNNNPVQNLCFEIKNWKTRTAKAGIKVNGVSLVAGPNFRQGVNIDTDGTNTLIVWVGLLADQPQSFEIYPEKN
jgi:hypothetical protein